MAWKVRLRMVFSESGQYRFRGGDLVADRHRRPRIGRKIDVDPGAEADESVPLPTRQRIACIHITQYTAGDQAGNLHASDGLSATGGNHQRIALIFNRSFV